MLSSVTPVNSYNPSFGGIVRVGKVVVNGVESHDFKIIDTAVKRLKAVLMRQADTKDTFMKNGEFRASYNIFDKDYVSPSCRMEGDTRDLMSKVRPKGSRETYIVTGSEATDMANSGVDIGRKRALERVSEGYKNYGAEENARVDYRDVKDEIADKFWSSKLHPQVSIYTETDKKGVLRLRGARLSNDLSSSKYYDLSPKTATEKQQKVVEKKTVVLPSKTENIPQKKEIVPPQENPLLKELETKNWDSVLLKHKKTRKPKKGENSAQMTFFDILK